MSAKFINQKILHVNLSERRYWVETPPERFYRKYGGGSAMGIYYILNHMDSNVDPLSPGNILTLFTGVTTGQKISGLSRISVNAKSPLTGVIGDSQSGGFFPNEIKKSGYDGIVIYGKSSTPVYLWINNGEVEIRDASHIWGKMTGDAEDIIKNELQDDKVEVMGIGPAGENLVRFAAIMNMANRANGRTGMGAVMGSKNLKAIAVKGQEIFTPADEQKTRELMKRPVSKMRTSPLHVHGTARTIGVANAGGGLPTHNYEAGQFSGYEKIDGETMTETMLKGRETCFSCAVQCKRVVETSYSGKPVLAKYGGPEYESIATFGSYCDVDNLEAVVYANQLCNMYGMDTISCGATIAFAMECFEKGVISKEDTDGIDLNFGNDQAMVEMVEKIAKRDGFGNILADGSHKAADTIGKNADEFLNETRGNEFPAHMPQAKRMIGLIYAVNPFGADHMSSEHDPFYEVGSANEQQLANMAQIGLDNPQPRGSMSDEKVRMLYLTQQYFSANDSFCLCNFVWGTSCRFYGPNETVEMIQAVTGWDISIDEYLEIGERRFNMMRVFNEREGLTRSDDQLPKKLFRPLGGPGPYEGVFLTYEQLENMKNKYYQFAGWDLQSGNPQVEKLKSLGLDWLVT